MYAPEQLVVYPTQGVGVIERLERQEIGGQEAEFYIIRIFTNNITVMVPVNNAVNVGLRRPCSLLEAEAVLASLQDRSTFTGYSGQNWNRRYREYSERLKSASLLDVGYVLKELILISGEKELSFGERRLLEQAMGLVAGELSCVLNKKTDEIRASIEDFYADVLIKQEKDS
ncbi:CarD family transcriptional regulator [Desulfovibrio sp. OttesenSCG-928-F20]|nr:CarD family transcriptional regulator [Desulfovibrio sp. OttesenSCG-928-F20]